MQTFRAQVVIAVVILGLCSADHCLASEEKESMAITAAHAWLALVDEGKFGESWESASTYFKNSVPKAKWDQMLNAARTPLGSLVARKLKSAKFTESLPGAPDGEYVVIRFSTSFEKKQSAIETITPMFDSDGVWRVSGYFIK
jgi:hypothetical protein